MVYVSIGSCKYQIKASLSSWLFAKSCFIHCQMGFWLITNHIQGVYLDYITVISGGLSTSLSLTHTHTHTNTTVQEWSLIYFVYVQEKCRISQLMDNKNKITFHLPGLCSKGAQVMVSGTHSLPLLVTHTHTNTNTHSDLKNIDSSELGADRCTLKNVHYVCSYLLIRNRPTLCLK